MKQLIISLVVALAAQVASAQDFGLTAGFRSTNADIEGATVSSGTGFQFGGLAWIPMTDVLYVRAGFHYTQKYFESKVGSTTVEYKPTYLDIPLTLMYRFSDFGGAFIGPVLSLNQSKDCSTNSGACSFTGVKSSLIPLQFGLSFKFAPQLGGELVYEMASGKIADNVENLRSLGANFVVWFE
ncbi:MAG: outer membrane beta-barrel protein [Pseudobdellovibrionaceae bacterium]